MTTLDSPTLHASAYDAGHQAGRADRERECSNPAMALDSWCHGNGVAFHGPFSDSFLSGYKAGNSK